MVRPKNYAPQEYDVVRDTVSELEYKAQEIAKHPDAFGDSLCAEAVAIINFMLSDESFELWDKDTEAEIEKILEKAGLNEEDIRRRARVYE